MNTTKIKMYIRFMEETMKENNIKSVKNNGALCRDVKWRVCEEYQFNKKQTIWRIRFHIWTLLIYVPKTFKYKM